MTRAYHGYFRPAEADRATQLSALQAFASQIGAPSHHSGGGWKTELTIWSDTGEKPTMLEERTFGAEMLRRLADGDILICPSIADLCDFPSNLAAVLRATIARGIAVHFLEMPGLTGAQLQPLVSAIAAATRPLEDARKRLGEELALVQKNAEARLEVALQAGMAEMAARWGLPSALRTGLAPLGDVNEPAVPPAASLGTAIATRRKELGLSQKQLAETLGISQPTFSRLEQSGEGENLSAVLDHLFANGAIHENAS